MKAVLFEKPAADSGSTVVADIEPPAVRPGQTLIDVEYAGINYIDIMARRGDLGYASGWPFVPGLELVGTVAPGSPDGRHPVGQRVAAFTAGGGLAEQAVASDPLVVPVPAGVEGPAGAAGPLMLTTALLLLRDAARFLPGETVLMHSAGGGVGGAVAQVAVALGGGRLVGTVGDANKVAAARAAGWAHVLVRDNTLAERFAAAAPFGADVVLDPLGTTMLGFDLEQSAPGGRIVIFGNPGGDAPGALPPVGQLIGRNVSVGGFSINRLSQTTPRRVGRALRDGLSLLAEGRVTLPVTVADGLHSVAQIHDLIAAGRSTGKHVVRVA